MWKNPKTYARTRKRVKKLGTHANTRKRGRRSMTWVGTSKKGLKHAIRSLGCVDIMVVCITIWDVIIVWTLLLFTWILHIQFSYYTKGRTQCQPYMSAVNECVAPESKPVFEFRFCVLVLSLCWAGGYGIDAPRLVAIQQAKPTLHPHNGFFFFQPRSHWGGSVHRSTTRQCAAGIWSSFDERRCGLSKRIDEATLRGCPLSLVDDVLDTFLRARLVSIFPAELLELADREIPCSHEIDWFVPIPLSPALDTCYLLNQSVNFARPVCQRLDLVLFERSDSVLTRVCVVSQQLV